MSNLNYLEQLISVITELTCFDHFKTRDFHYEIVWNWNQGHSYWYVQHDGYIWEIDYKNNGKFKTFDQAVNYFISILQEKIKEELKWHRDEQNRKDEPDHGWCMMSPFSLEELDKLEEKLKE